MSTPVKLLIVEDSEDDAELKHSIASLQAIRAMGVSIAIDDFGTAPALPAGDE